MITLSFDDLRLIAQIRNISDYKEDLISKKRLVNQKHQNQNQKHENQN